MSCIHNVWNCYCKAKQDVIEKPCSPLCKNYCTVETSIKNNLNKILAENTGKDIDTIALDTDRNNWMSAEEAAAYGLVDKVISKKEI